MRKYYVLLALLAESMSAGSLAQAQITLMVRAGVGISKGKSDYSAIVSNGVTAGWVAGFNAPSITKPYAGISAQFGLSKELFLEPEIGYAVMGVQEIGYSARLHESMYVTVPISVRYQANKVLGVYAGPYVGYRIRAANYPPDLLGSWDAGFQVGGEVKIFRNVGLGGRFYNGLLNVYKDLYDEYPDQYGEDLKLYNRCLQLYVSYSFDLKKDKNN